MAVSDANSTLQTVLLRFTTYLPIQREGQPFGDIRVGISTVLLKSEIKPQLTRALFFSAIAILMSLALAAGVSNIALRPLEAIGRRLEQMTAGVPDIIAEPDPLCYLDSNTANPASCSGDEETHPGLLATMFK